MIRTFHSVGQGAFYSEVFHNGKDSTIVYDCGTSSDLNILINEIRNTFQRNHIIDALFISHFHNDHVNGLDFLLDYCNVKRIFLPLLTNEDKIYSLIDNYYNGNDGDNKILLDTREFVRERAHLIFIDSYESKDKYHYVDNYDIYLYDDELINNQTITSGRRLYFRDIPDWLFVPFNFRHDERSKRLKNELKKMNITFTEIEDFINCWNNEDDKDRIIEAYKKIPGDFNTNSLTLYSGPINANEFDVFFHEGNLSRLFYPYHFFGMYRPGCLYLGDYDANGRNMWNGIETEYNFIWDNIGMIQLPHHGSKHNYNRRLIRKNRAIFTIISAGSNNKYRHPHTTVLRDIIFQNIPVHVVNENSWSRMIVEVV